MVKPVSQQQKEYLKRLKEKKQENIWRKKGKGDTVESHRQAKLQ